MIVFYNTKQQTIDSVNELLTAHGYDPAEYDAEKIAENYMHKPGLYNSVFENPSMVWPYVDQHHAPATDTPPANFVPRDWDAPEHADIAPRDRFEVYDGPTHGGTTTHWEPDHGVGINVDGYCDVGQGITMRIDVARRLRDDLTKVLAKIDQ